MPLVITSFRSQDAEQLFKRERVKRFRNIERAARRKLEMLDAATTLGDLRALHGNRLEELVGNRKGQHSIRINDQFRICFVWRAGNAELVEIVDYHSGIADMAKLKLVHPGEILQEEFLKPLGVSQYRLANDIGVPPRRINEIVLGKRGITADTALRLGRYFGTSPQFWMNLQARYDLEMQSDLIGNQLQKVRALRVA